MNLTSDLLKINQRIDSRTSTEPITLNIETHPRTTILSSPTNLIFISYEKYISKPEIPHTGQIRITSNNDKLTKYLRKIYKGAGDIESLLISYNCECYIVQIEITIAYSDHFPIMNIVKGINMILLKEKCIFYEPRCFYMNSVIDPLNDEDGSEMLIVFSDRNVVFLERMGEFKIEDLINGINICTELR